MIDDYYYVYLVGYMYRFGMFIVGWMFVCSMLFYKCRKCRNFLFFDDCVIIDYGVKGI